MQTSKQGIAKHVFYFKGDKTLYMFVVDLFQVQNIPFISMLCVGEIQVPTSVSSYM